jgi:hypothetical protein
MQNNLIIIGDIDTETLRKNIIEALQRGICEITFDKVNGERRVMPCTLKTEFLPEKNQKDLTFEALKESKSDAISVWCTDANGWRSFKLSNFISINPLNDH